MQLRDGLVLPQQPVHVHPALCPADKAGRCGAVWPLPCKVFGEFCQVVLAWKVESGNPANPSYSRAVHRRGYAGTPPGHDGGAWRELTWSVHYSPCVEQETGAITASLSGARVFFCVVMGAAEPGEHTECPEPSTQKWLKG